MTKLSGVIKSENKLAEFQAYEPVLHPLSSSRGGGFRLTLEIPETEYIQVKDLNDPLLKNTILKITIFKEL